MNVTIAYNNVGASGTGGGLEVDDGTASLYNTIVAQNTAGTGPGATPSDINAVSPGTVTGSFNLIGTGGSGGLTNDVNHNQLGVANPLLGPLASNGGLTQTIAVLPGSPAIGMGSDSIPGVTVPPTDQRGVPRPPDSVDVGAFQDQGFILTIVSGSPQTTAVSTAFASPLIVKVTSPEGDPVAGGLVIFAAPSSGPSAVLTGSPALIGMSGEASVTAFANGIAGSYGVTATNPGATAPVSFSLTNVAVVHVTGVTVKWGSAASDALVVPGPSGGTLLPAGRKTDLPWLGISQLVISLSGTQSLTRNEITISSAIGYNYGPTSVSGSASTYTITLGRPIIQADIVTFMISGLGVTTFTGVLPVLPGDFNDDGIVNYPDETGVLYEILGVTKPTIFGDINGDGKVTPADYQYIVGAQRAKLPSMGPSSTPFSNAAAISSAGSKTSSSMGTTSESAAPAAQSASVAATPAVVRTAAAPLSRTLAPRAEIRLALQGKPGAFRSRLLF